MDSLAPRMEQSVKSALAAVEPTICKPSRVAPEKFTSSRSPARTSRLTIDRPLAAWRTAIWPSRKSA
jgi:hypothetical protein